MRRLLPWLIPIVTLGLLVGLLQLVSGFLGDPTRHFEIGALGSVQFVLNTNAAALTSAMSVLIALVLLTVQLTAQRYSFNVIGIFIHNWVNSALIGLFILTISFNLWLGLVLREDYIPAGGILLGMAMTTLCFALLPPYILYLFSILRPNSILDHLRRRFLSAVDASHGTAHLARHRAAATQRINQIGDIARTAVNLSDSAVARQSVWVLYWSIARYVDDKSRLPGEWHAVEERHFRGRHALVIREIEETRTWLERRMLDEVQEVFFATLNKMHDVNNTVALVVRQLGEKAIERGDTGLLRTVIKFFNTFLRAAINQADQRAGYHVLYQYRLLAAATIERYPRYPDVTLEIANRLSYYGDAAVGGPLLWMAAAAAYDLRMLAEVSHERRADARITAEVVERLLETVRRSEAKGSPALLQLYKTVAALGTFFLVRGELGLARQLRASLDGVPADTLRQIAAELDAIEDPIFWELTDRVVNFDYVEPDARAALPTFLGQVDQWVVGVSPPTPPAIRKARAPAS